MKSDRDLRQLLEQIDRRSYPAYKSAKGSYDFKSYILNIDHVQGDPFASPSHITVKVKGSNAGFPKEYYESRHRRIALQDFLCRRFHKAASEFDRVAGGSGKSGAIITCAPGQEVLERTAIHIDDSNGDISYRLHIGFPANGRTINSRELIKMLFDFLPKCVKSSLYFSDGFAKNLEKAVFLADDISFIRKELKNLGLCAFIADGSSLPRASGISCLPMKDAVPFRSPESLQVTLKLPHKGETRGMGIKKGVTLIVGGGYHGKSTLLKALELGVYDHISGDGREYVITDDTAMKIRSEDGRSIHGTDISLFIKNLPDRRDTKSFHSEDASGSTSQAANVIEAIESGSKVLLIDEDTCATNFMIRDDLMQKVISPDREPITPFMGRIRPFSEQGDISTILVAGSFGAYFHIADTIIQMYNYNAVDITDKAKEAASAFPYKSVIDDKTELKFVPKYPVLKKKLDLNGRIKTKTFGTDGFSIEHDTVELRYLEQLVDGGQSGALCKALLILAGKYFDKGLSLEEMTDKLISLMEKNGPDALFSDSSYTAEGLTAIRKQELMAALSRCRFIDMKS